MSSAHSTNSPPDGRAWRVGDCARVNGSSLDYEIAHHGEAGRVIEADVAEHGPFRGLQLVRLDFGQGRAPLYTERVVEWISEEQFLYERGLRELAR